MANLVSYILAACVVMMPVMSAPSQDPPNDVCHGLDCPTYIILNQTNDWELRRYDVVTWVATTMEGIDIDSTKKEMFDILFQYIAGANTMKAKIPMTSPVLTKVIHGQGPNCESTFVMNFMVPHDLWKSPIPPTNPKVSIAKSPAMDVYVRSFGGYANGTDYTNNLELLYKSLPSDAQIEDKYFFTAGYDGPYQFTHRHNEVWIQKS